MRSIFPERGVLLIKCSLFDWIEIVLSQPHFLYNSIYLTFSVPFLFCLFASFYHLYLPFYLVSIRQSFASASFLVVIHFSFVSQALMLRLDFAIVNSFEQPAAWIADGQILLVQGQLPDHILFSTMLVLPSLRFSSR